MSTKVNINWSGDMSFVADVGGFAVQMDASREAGGKGKGPRPKPLTLAALGGCTGMDVISILEKMRVHVVAFDMQIEAEETEEHPKVYRRIHIIYRFKGNDLPMDKLEKAVNLSQERYCGVSAMLRQAAEVTYEINV
ncbi:MAG: OsmC family protein [Bacteroidales bacterium]|nr:OsmC family protein [Lentimicrobiaceae bacterium]MDD5694844.1 OsmC family protein [Bacteroidales bacterium]